MALRFGIAQLEQEYSILFLPRLKQRVKYGLLSIYEHDETRIILQQVQVRQQMIFSTKHRSWKVLHGKCSD